MKWFRWWWLLGLVPILAGLARLHFDAEMLDLLPAEVPAVQGLKIYQQHFTDARELILTVRAPDRDSAEQAARSIAEALQHANHLVATVTWEPPWQEHPEQTAELIAYLWLNQPPADFKQLAGRLSGTNLVNVLAATREQLATTLSPNEIAQLSYDPFGLTRLPESVAGTVSGFGSGAELFASADGTFRIIFVKARGELNGYRECTDWFNAVKQVVGSALPADAKIHIGYTGRPAFTAEISGSMQHDMKLSVGGTALIIAILFWCAHRRLKPMLWLLTLLALILAATLALGGLIFGAVNVISMGFAAILLGLAVDYAVVHYQEALAQPELSIPEIRRAIAPSIFWAAITTISAFLVLNFGGLPGLAQLGSLVAIGFALAACVMIFAFLPPLFPQRMGPHSGRGAAAPDFIAPLRPLHINIIFAGTAILILICAPVLFSGLPKMDPTADALRPRDSQANTTLDAIKFNLNQKREPLWLLVSGRDESEVARKLDAILPVLNAAISNRTLSGFTSPTALWPHPAFQLANRVNAQKLAADADVFRATALTNGFSPVALGLTGSILETWRRAAATTNVFWPTNPLCIWIFERMAVHEPPDFFAVSFLYLATNAWEASFARLDAQLPHEGVWLSGWDLLGGTVLAAVQKNLWKLLLPMVGLILLSLWLAFRRFTEVFISLGILLLSGFCLLAAMKIFGWSWNLLNLMALPLILGTGVDYSIFMQLALRRHGGDLKLAHASVGKALLLCGGTAIAGFGMLGLSSNTGLSSLGRVCAIGIAGNMLISVFLLPVWWKLFAGATGMTPSGRSSWC